MEDMAGEAGLGEDEGGLEEGEGADFEADFEGEVEDMVEDGNINGIIFWEGGLQISTGARKAWRWRHEEKRNGVFMRTGPCLLAYIRVCISSSSFLFNRYPLLARP